VGMALLPSPDVYGVISQRLSVLVRSNMLSSPMTKRPEPQTTRSGSPRPGSAEDSINVDVAELLGNTGVDGYTQMLEEGHNWETQYPDLFEEFYADSDEDEEMWYDAEMAMDAYDDSYHEPYVICDGDDIRQSVVLYDDPGTSQEGLSQHSENFGRFQSHLLDESRDYMYEISPVRPTLQLDDYGQSQPEGDGWAEGDIYEENDARMFSETADAEQFHQDIYEPEAVFQDYPPGLAEEYEYDYLLERLAEESIASQGSVNVSYHDELCAGDAGEAFGVDIAVPDVLERW